MIEIEHLKVEYKHNPIGMDEPFPRFSYQLRYVKKQCARRIQVQHSNGTLVWDSLWQADSASIQIVYAGEPLQPFTRYFWRVKVRDERGVESLWSSEEAFFETAFLDTPWQGRWIAGRIGAGSCQPVQRLFQDFRLPGNKEVRSARLYATALGVYEAFLNGKRVGDQVFTPGWSDYFKRVQFQAYDVTSFFADAQKMYTLAFHLGEGWYNGRIARHWRGGSVTYGAENLLKCELHVTFADHSKFRLVSDGAFQHISDDGAIRYSDIYDGEWCEAWRDRTWLLPGGNRRFAQPCSEKNPPREIRLDWQQGAEVRVVDELEPQQIIRRAPGNYIVDFGQNFTGREQITLHHPPRGMTITIKHGEMLQEDGSLYTENLRSALATTIYSCAGEACEVYEPTFTFYGFRYLEIGNWPGVLRKSQIRARVLSCDLPRTGKFHCSESLLNQLYNNMLWGQTSNFLDIPTDCPQRDERMGWTGDTQVFMPTATYNSACASFYSKWIADLNSCIETSGAIPNIIPSPYDGWKGDPGWSDAAIICPYVMLEKYGDRRLIAKYLDNMERWLDYERTLADEDGIIRRGTFGDWLNVDDPTPPEFIWSAYYAKMNDLCAFLAERVENHPVAQRRKRVFRAAKAAFRAHFIDEKGQLRVNSQSALLLALNFGLLEDGWEQECAAQMLLDKIRERGCHLSTGFLGTPFLLKTLVNLGEAKLAEELLLQTSYPGWLYSILQGATTMWERWNSYTHEHGFGDVEMNSFNHYAYGAVAEFFYENICGIKPDNQKRESCAFHHFRLEPVIFARLEFAQASFESAYGMIQSAWKKTAPGVLEWRVTIPANTSATVTLPQGYRLIDAPPRSFCRESERVFLAMPGRFKLMLQEEKRA